jgi:HYR domain
VIRTRRGNVVGALAVVALASTAAAAAAMPVHRARGRESDVLKLRGAVRITGNHEPTCPAGTADGIECHLHTGVGLVPGLGRVTTSYSFRVNVAQSDCVRVLGYPVTLTVVGKGSIDLVVDPIAGCLSAEAVLSAPQGFTIVGGSGLYAEAHGNGTLSRALSSQPAAVVGTETFSGTLIVAGVEFDTTKPTFSGATSRTVRAPHRSTRARVRYRVTAVDDRDGRVPVTCRPASGARFRVGRTTVTCSAVDTSGNRATARFVVTVRRG